MTLEVSTTHHDDDAIDDDDQDDIPYSVLRPTPRKRSLPPLPDLRFEQSYLRSISNADAWWKVLLITARDQVRGSHIALGPQLALTRRRLSCPWRRA